MPGKWFIKTKAGPQGPVDCKMLVRLANMGKLKPNTPVSDDGESWIKAKAVPELSFLSDKSGKGDEPKWYVLTKHGTAGPFRLRKLQKLADQGRIQPSLAVSRDKENWINATHHRQAT